MLRSQCCRGCFRGVGFLRPGGRPEKEARLCRDVKSHDHDFDFYLARHIEFVYAYESFRVCF